MQADVSLCWSHIPHCWKSCVGSIIKLALKDNLECANSVPKYKEFGNKHLYL